MIRINNDLLDSLTGLAENAARKRKNHNFHTEAADPLQRMLNAMEPGTYVHPHKHEGPDKREAFLVLRGKILLVEFDKDGNISDHQILSMQSGQFGAEVAAGVYHMLIALEKGTVLYEVKDGPYDPTTDKNFAHWAPGEGSAEAEKYLEGILAKTISQ